VVRPRVLIKTLVTAYKTDDSLPSKLLQVRKPVVMLSAHDQAGVQTSTSHLVGEYRPHTGRCVPRAAHLGTMRVTLMQLYR